MISVRTAPGRVARAVTFNGLAGLVLSTAGLAAQEKLGTIDFPTSGSIEAQSHFLRGVLFLHSFEYASALEAFEQARTIDEDFALAYWGEAMTHNHPLWKQQDRDAARAALGRLAPTAAARAARAPTAREKGYLAAVEALYGEGSKSRRDTLYSSAMARLARDFPGDDEARTFYALSLLGLSDGERDIPTYVRAAATALPVFRRKPDHPGAAHYVIHSFDDPVHAPLGLEAAKAYSGIAPDAAHAQHMTSHIFVAMGMWDDVVTANETATAITTRFGLSRWPCGHYAEWLIYGYLQQGRPAAAEELWHECRRVTLEREWPDGSPPGLRGTLGRMRATYLVDAEVWDGGVTATEIDAAGVDPYLEARDQFGLGLADIGRGYPAGAEARLEAIRALIGSETPFGAGHIAVHANLLEASLAFQAGDAERALALAREAAGQDEGLPMDFGPPMAAKPPRELLGELLLELGRHEEAAEEFEGSLRRTPQRSRSLLGLARAASELGHEDRATAAYRALREIWRHAEPEASELAEATDWLERHAATGGG